MKKILCFGEALIDFLNTGHTPEGPLQIANFRQFPGGAPANVAVAVAKLGGVAAFAGQVGNDHFGRFLQQTLDTYGVDTSAMSLHASAPTALAFVFLDESAERSFEFYRKGTADIVLSKNQIDTAWFDDCAIVHVCSNTLVEDDILATTRYVLETARAKNCVVSFDVNLRHNLWPQGQCDREMVRSVMHYSDIVKASREELDYLEPDGPAAFATYAFGVGARLVVVTDGARPVEVYRPKDTFSFAPPRVTVADTTAAGDAFVGGMLYKLAAQEDQFAALSDREALMDILRFASRCGAFAASQIGVMNALPTLESIQAVRW